MMPPSGQCAEINFVYLNPRTETFSVRGHNNQEKEFFSHIENSRADGSDIP